MNFEKITISLVVLSALFAQHSHAENQSWACYGKFAHVLSSSDFPGADCKSAFVKIRYLGKIKIETKEYIVYQYRYEDGPRLLNGRSQHSLKRILIFLKNIRNYIGNYAMDDGFEAKVMGGQIHVFTDTPKLDGRIVIGPDGPPKIVYYGGDEATFDP